MDRSICPICGQRWLEFIYWKPENAVHGYFYTNCYRCGSTIRYKEEDLMTHWKELYLGGYKDMDLIDRNALLESMHKEAQEIENDEDMTPLDDDFMFAISLIEGAPKINAVDIVEEYEKRCEEEQKYNP